MYFRSLYPTHLLIVIVLDRLDKRHGQALVAIDIKVDGVNGIAAGDGSDRHSDRHRDRLGSSLGLAHITLTLKGYTLLVTALSSRFSLGKLTSRNARADIHGGHLGAYPLGGRFLRRRDVTLLGRGCCRRGCGRGVVDNDTDTRAFLAGAELDLGTLGESGLGELEGTVEAGEVALCDGGGRVVVVRVRVIVRIIVRIIVRDIGNLLVVIIIAIIGLDLDKLDTRGNFLLVAEALEVGNLLGLRS